MNSLGYPVIDADGHVEESGVDWVKRLDGDWGDWAPRYISDGRHESGQGRLAIEGKIFPRWEDKWGRGSRPITVHKAAHQWTGRPGMTDPQARLADMDLEGIDVAVLFGGALSSAAIGLVENPARTVGADRFDNFFLKHVFYGADVFMAFAGILAGGVLERFPGLRLGVFEAGCGWIPYLMERLHEHWELFPDQLPHLTRDPAEQ